MSEKWEDPTNKEMRLYAEKAKRRKEEGFAFNDKGNRKTQNVKVVSIDIPFGDVMSLTFKALFASLIVFAIPVAFIIMIAIINS